MPRINEIFTSIDGEVNRYGQGVFTTFIRFQGCLHRCDYCDTEYALDMNGGMEMSIEEIMKAISQGPKKVTITGGEPLLSSDFPELINALLAAKYQISIETNGSMMPALDLPVGGWDRLSWIFDYKLPSSKMHKMNMPQQRFFFDLPFHSWIKFVICTKEDLDIAVVMTGEMMAKVHKVHWPKIAFSPCIGIEGAITPDEIVRTCAELGLWEVVINLQIHKFLFPNGEKQLLGVSDEE
jgi:7-carboxy-7-deazaguanine synthase